MRKTYIGILSLVILPLVVGCSHGVTSLPSTSTPTGNPSAMTNTGAPRTGGLPPIQVTYRGITLVPVAGPIRSELIDSTKISPTGLVFNDWNAELITGNQGRLVYQIAGVPLSEGFLIRSGSPNGLGIHDSWVGTPTLYFPACYSGMGAEILTTFPNAKSTANNTPIPLSAEGLLKAGWPNLYFEFWPVQYRGFTYNPISFRYINNAKADSSISPILLEQVEVLSITYPVHVGNVSVPVLSGLLSDQNVTDHIRIYRYKDKPLSDTILIDEAPADLVGSDFVYFQAVNR